MKRNIIVSVILLVLMITTVCMKSLWIGFVYFSLSFLAVLCMYWFAVLITYYIEDYHNNFEEDFKEYRAEIINSSTLTSEEFDQNQQQHLKKFKKSLRKYKLIDIVKMLFLVMVIVACIVAMAKGNFKI